MRTMRTTGPLALAVALLLVSSAETRRRSPADVADVPFRIATTKWDTATLGNHRAVVRVDATATVVHVVVPWRRRDANPSARLVIVVNERGERVGNVRRGRIDQDAGELWFEPTAGPGHYFVYYLPSVTSGRKNYPTVTYPAPEETANLEWTRASADAARTAPAVVEAIEAIDEFNRFDPMEVIATSGEVSQLLRDHAGAAFLVVAEDRTRPIRMRRNLPQRWVATGDSNRVDGEARRGEYFAFQLGIYAIEPLEGVQVRFTDLRSPAGNTVLASRLGCINTHGVNWDGSPFDKRVDVASGEVQALWCGVDVPVDLAPARYEGNAVVAASGRGSTTVPVSLTVKAEAVADGGAGEPWKQTRLKWLDSTLAQGNDVVAPYTPLQVNGDAIRLLGRRVVLAPGGLPAALETFFTEEMTSVGSEPNSVLSAPVALVAERPDGTIAWRAGAPSFTERAPGTVRWRAVSSSAELEMQVEGALEFDGYLSYAITVRALRDVLLSDIRLQVPYARNAATYMMGLGQKGGYRPPTLDWTWDVASKNQDGAWLGAVNAGLAFSLRGDNYSRPLNTNFYLEKPLLLPPSWGNGGKGGISIRELGNGVFVTAFSGRRAMHAGEELRFDVNFTLTPFHPIDTASQWATRFYHRYAPVDTIKATGATVVNVHHATAINPWINYPFVAWREMKAYIDEAHRAGLRVKIYNTVRELSNHAYELFALRSLGHEVFTPGPGGGFSWLQEHVGDDYIAAWFVPELQDAAIINSGMSRWHNYYVEGMNWLVRNVGIDGIYLDDVAFDRTTMKRLKRVLTRDGHPGIVDLHSANQFNERDGFINSALLYLEHFPYLNRLWFGEYFDYDKNTPEFFLTEVSGIPFGLMGEMLEGGGNPWRGMVYGMTNRMPWTENSDPRPIWKVWDGFGMADTEMIGYWVSHSPVRTNRPDVLATVYRKDGAALVALASWATSDTDVSLTIDWDALRLDPAATTIEAPDVKNFQAGRRFVPGESIPVQRGKGWLLVLREQ